MSYTQNYYDFKEDETIWLATVDGGRLVQYIVAPDEQRAQAVCRRIFDRRKFNFDWAEVGELEDTGSTDIESMVRGDEQPFSVIVPQRYYLVEYEKRVNQGGFKGIYQRYLNY